MLTKNTNQEFFADIFFCSRFTNSPLCDLLRTTLLTKQRPKRVWTKKLVLFKLRKRCDRKLQIFDYDTNKTIDFEQINSTEERWIRLPKLDKPLAIQQLQNGNIIECHPHVSIEYTSAGKILRDFRYPTILASFAQLENENLVFVCKDRFSVHNYRTGAVTYTESQKSSEYQCIKVLQHRVLLITNAEIIHYTQDFRHVLKRFRFLPDFVVRKVAKCCDGPNNLLFLCIFSGELYEKNILTIDYMTSEEKSLTSCELSKIVFLKRIGDHVVSLLIRNKYCLRISSSDPKSSTALPKYSAEIIASESSWESSIAEVYPGVLACKGKKRNLEMWDTITGEMVGLFEDDMFSDEIGCFLFE
jgi:hypothetical protein